jgi:hypothetical protein
LLIVLVGLLVVSIPVGLAVRTVMRLVRTLGAVDAGAIGELLDHPSCDLDALTAHVERAAPGSIAQRVLTVVRPSDDRATLLQRKLALAEEVADIERGIVSDMRVPRVAASLSSTGGLLAASLVMREGLGITLPEGADPIPIYNAVIEKGLTLALLAVFGGLACASLHRAGQRERRARLAELDALVVPLSARLFGEEI